MMWAATVRRCPTGHVRHPSQFGARLQLARALTHAPYLICDGVYSCPPPTHANFDPEASVGYNIRYSDPQVALSDPDIICDHVFDCDSSLRTLYQPAVQSRRGVLEQDSESSQGSYRVDRLSSRAPTETQYQSHSREGRRTVAEGEEVRVELPYSRRELEADESYPVGEHIVRRYEDIGRRDEQEDDGPVGLSYQQRSLGGGPYGGQVWGSEPSIDCWGDRPFLLKRGRTRELVRTSFIVSLSLTLVTFVVMGFVAYNMLITTLFLFFLLSTVSLLIFLLMRKPSCFSCCKDPFDVTSNADEDAEVQQNLNTYMTESQGVVIKKRLSDSPPPYESPPDYDSLPPEVLVSARGLSSFESNLQDSFITRIHGESPVATTPKPISRRSRIRTLAAKSSSSLLSSAAPLLSSAKRSSPPASPQLCTSGRLLGLASSCRPTAESGEQEASSPPTPPPPPYDCLVIQTELSEKDNQKGC